MSSLIRNEAQFYAPAWAISLKRNYHYFERHKNTEAAYGVFHAGRMALEARFDCDFEESTGFFHSDVEPIESSRFYHD